MKKFAVFILSVILCTSCLSIAAVPVAADAEQVTLNVYNWGEYISNGEDDSMDVIAEFELRNPDIDVIYTTFDTNESMYAKIASGSANYDVIIPSDYMIGRMIQEDMLAKLDYNNIPNFQYIDERFRNLEYDPQNEYSVPYTWGTVGIIYNTTMVTEPVDSWDILWDEKYAGQVLMFDNPRDAFGIAMKKLGYSQNSTNRAEIDEAKEVLQQQKAAGVVQAYVMDQIFSKLPAKEAAMAPYYAGDFFTMLEDNEDLAFAIPKEGTNLFVDAMVVPKTSEHKEEAERFINFMLEPDVALANIEFIGYSTPMSNVRDMLDDEVKNSPISYPSDEQLANCETFINLDEETNAYLQESWTEVLSYGDNNTGALIMVCIVAVAVVALLVFLFIRKRRQE